MFHLRKKRRSESWDLLVGLNMETLWGVFVKNKIDPRSGNGGTILNRKCKVKMNGDHISQEIMKIEELIGIL